MEGFQKCEMCDIPLNREIVSKENPKLCFECAEEGRQFTPEESPLVEEGATESPENL